MQTIGNVLNQRKWSDLRAVAGAHGLPFSGRKTRLEETARLTQHLSAVKTMRHVIRNLTEAERDALLILKAAGGCMDYYKFTAVFGAVRLYRPWRYDSPRQPWKHPISIAEKLWLLAFIAIEDEQIVAPSDVLALLPSLSQVEPLPAEPQPQLSTPLVLLVDLAQVLGVLMAQNVQVRWQRWLPLSALRQINAQLKIKDDLEKVRSELQSGRLRFLLYLLEVAGLVAVQTGTLKPTVNAWSWLDRPYTKQWQHIMESVESDLARPKPLWNIYRLPPVTLMIWQRLCQELSRLETGHSYSFPSLLRLMRLKLPDANLQYLAELMDSVLVWVGRISLVNGDAFQLMPINFPEPQKAVLHLEQDRLYITVPESPMLRPLVELSSWAIPENDHYYLSAEEVRQAAQQGITPDQISDILRRLIGAPLSAAVLNRLRDWASLDKSLRLETRSILTSQDPRLLSEMMLDRSLRPLLDKSLSPHHLAIKPQAAATLCGRLKRRGLPVIYAEPPQVEEPSGELSSDLAQTLWIAGRVYQYLGRLVELPVPIPGSILDWLKAHIPVERHADLHVLARQTMSGVAEALKADGHGLKAVNIVQTDPEGIRNAVESAYQNRTALTVDYFSPADGHISRRRIEPITPLMQRGDFVYFQAWCSLAEEERTFRLDRILRIVQDSSG